mmetsp:Transcript_11775/g.37762  ORF Transcript_11775/g.37762 Transcript_11775/m.37762 type:complete len:254 (+) Transcript_11775:331-1092(+)
MRRRLRARWKRRAIGTPSSTSPAARHAAFRAQCRGVHRRATDAPSVPAFSALVRRQRCSRSGSFRPLRRTYLTRMRRTRQAVGLMSPSCPAPREQETVMRSRRCSHLARRMRPGGTATQSLRPTPPSSRPRPKAPAQRSWKSFLPTVTRLPRVQTTSWTPLSRLPSMSWPRSAANTTPCSPISTGAERIFEFQVQPQLIALLAGSRLADRLDYGTICCYVCSKSCDATDEAAPYLEEFAHVQPEPYDAWLPKA